jgi:hypothetical protein
MVSYNSFQSYDGNYYSNSFLNLNADLSVNIAFELVTKINPEYLIITHKKGNEIFRYIYYTYKFVKTVNAYPEDWKYIKKNLTLEEVLNLHEYTSDITIEINDDFPFSEKNLEIINNLKNSGNIAQIIIVRKDKPIGIISFDSQTVLANKNFLIKGLPKTRGLSPNLVARAGVAAGTRGYTAASPSPPPPEFLSNLTIIKRYPNAIFPNKISINEIATLTVSLNVNQPSSSDIGINLTVQPDEKEINVLVNIRPGNFEVIDNNYSIIKVPVEPKDSEPVKFQIKAKEEGNLTLFINFYQNGIYVGDIKIDTIVEGKNVQLDKPKQDLNYTGSNLPKINNSSTEKLTMIIQEKSISNFEYQVIIYTSRLSYKVMNPIIKFTSDPQDKFNSIFQDLENKEDLPADFIEDNIKGIGYTLYDQLFPKDLQEYYWKHKDDLKSIVILSSEPWIPWEIIKPWRKLENGNIEEDPYLCEKFDLTRWIEGKEFVEKSTLKSGLIVIPNDTNLKNALLESDWLIKFGDDLKIDLTFNNTYQEIISALKNNGFDLIHFSTHGKSDPSNVMFSSIVLQNGLYIRPENISGITTNFGKSNPLVFLNACQSGSQGFFLTGIEGWAQRFIDNGASIFIGTRWSVNDKIALDFSKEFYTNISNGKPIGESIRLARLKCRKPGESSWLAYQVYAEPNSCLKLI